MALCSFCGGYFDLDVGITPMPPVIPIYDPEPYCSKCGQRKYTPCYTCNGRGYTLGPSLLPEYCTKCGREIKRNTRQTCFYCQGSGQIPHLCRGF